MKVTIDTKEDTHEDIRKVLHILTEILERKGITPAANVDTSSMMSMFNDAAESQTTPEKSGSAPDFSSFLNLTKKQEEDKKELQEWKIQYY